MPRSLTGGVPPGSAIRRETANPAEALGTSLAATLLFVTIGIPACYQHTSQSVTSGATNNYPYPYSLLGHMNADGSLTSADLTAYLVPPRSKTTYATPATTESADAILVSALAATARPPEDVI